MAIVSPWPMARSAASRSGPSSGSKPLSTLSRLLVMGCVPEDGGAATLRGWRRRRLGWKGSGGEQVVDEREEHVLRALAHLRGGGRGEKGARLLQGGLDGGLRLCREEKLLDVGRD